MHQFTVLTLYKHNTYEVIIYNVNK